eukprot:scaffold291993_cov24-Tisochrysis_lutea.AAC.7
MGESKNSGRSAPAPPTRSGACVRGLASVLASADPLVAAAEPMASRQASRPMGQSERAPSQMPSLPHR